MSETFSETILSDGVPTHDMPDHVTIKPGSQSNLSNQQDSIFNDKSFLLKELEELGINPSGRKTRADKGAQHTMVKARSDKGKPRPSYNLTMPRAGVARPTHKEYNTQSAAFLRTQYFKVYESFITRDAYGEITNDPTTDNNNIFVLNYTHRTIDQTINTPTPGVTKTIHKTRKITKQLESMRWAWWQAQMSDPCLTKPEQDKAAAKFFSHYHIRPEDLTLWTFSEWASAYLKLSNMGGTILAPEQKIIYDLKGEHYVGM